MKILTLEHFKQVYTISKNNDNLAMEHLPENNNNLGMEELQEDLDLQEDLQEDFPVVTTLSIYIWIALYFYEYEEGLCRVTLDYFSPLDEYDYIFLGIVDISRRCLVYFITTGEFTCPPQGLHNSAKIEYIIVPEGEVKLTTVESIDNISLFHGQGGVMLTLYGSHLLSDAGP